MGEIVSIRVDGENFGILGRGDEFTVQLTDVSGQKYDFLMSAQQANLLQAYIYRGLRESGWSPIAPG